VIDRIMKGRDITGLLYYLFGPGKSDEHVNPHLVAGWRDPIRTMAPPLKSSGKRDFRRLANALNAPLDVVGRRGQPGTVWHCVLSAAPGDRLLSDAEWNAIAAEFMHQMGLAARDDPYGVRWVAIRHGLSRGGIDHVHIAATLARQDGGLPSVHNDFVRARRACRAIEQQFGLAVTAPADRTAAVRPTRAETEQAARRGQDEPPRVTLRRLVQDVAAVAASEQDYFARLKDAGVLIRERRSADQGRITGYAVALPGHTSSTGAPVWYGGGKLAPDLTLPKLRRRWERARNTEHAEPLRADNLSARSARAFIRSAALAAAEHARNEAEYFSRLEAAGLRVRYRYSDRNPDEVTGYALTLPGHQDAEGEPVWYGGGRLADGLTLPRLRSQWNGGVRVQAQGPDPAERRAMWADVIRLTAGTAAQVRQLIQADPVAAADVAYATADALRITARVVRGPAWHDLRQAASGFDRAAREAFAAVPRRAASADPLRTAVRLLSVLATVPSSPTLHAAMLVENLSALARSTAELRDLQGRAHQAAAARSAAALLRRHAQMTRRVPAARITRPGPPSHRKPG
jgi:hypothetical protein